ncbi:MAG: hypothetical protein P0116_08440 [Candidatus Nitrosocosmicus sp.]|nr:hypothetical protein [Candidatus Nitrosocosmicus sp.]
MDRNFNTPLCICFVSVFLTIVCVMYGGVTIIHKSYSQQRNTTIPLDGQATKLPDGNTATKPYLSITMQTIKDYGGYSSTGERYIPTDGSVTVIVDENGKQRIAQHPLINSENNTVTISNISIFPSFSFSMSNLQKSNSQNIEEISRVFSINNITKDSNGQLYQGISKYTPITVNDKVYPGPVASFYIYNNGTGTLNIHSNNPPEHAH